MISGIFLLALWFIIFAKLSLLGLNLRYKYRLNSF